MKPYYYPFIDTICFELIEFIIFYDVHKSNQFNGLINWLKVESDCDDCYSSYFDKLSYRPS